MKRYVIQGLLLLKNIFFIKSSIFVLVPWESPEGPLKVPGTSCACWDVPVVTLSINDNKNLLDNIKQWLKRAISWNKYRSQITAQTKKNSLDYMIDPTFKNINTFFHSKMVTVIPQEIIFLLLYAITRK